MGGNSDSEFFYIPKCILGTLGTICHGKKNWGSLNWSETPYFHKGGPLQMEPQLPLSAEKKGKNFFFKQLYLGN